MPLAATAVNCTCDPGSIGPSVHRLGAGGRAGDARGGIARQHYRATPIQCERDGRFEREGDYAGHIGVHRDRARAYVVGATRQTPVGHVRVRSWRTLDPGIISADPVDSVL